MFCRTYSWFTRVKQQSANECKHLSKSSIMNDIENVHSKFPTLNILACFHRSENKAVSFSVFLIGRSCALLWQRAELCLAIITHTPDLEGTRVHANFCVVIVYCTEVSCQKCQLRNTAIRSKMCYSLCSVQVVLVWKYASRLKPCHVMCVVRLSAAEF